MANHLDTRKITFWGKSQPYELSLIQKLNFGIDKTFRALKIVAWPFSTQHVDINKRVNIDYTLPFKSNQKVFIFVSLKFPFYFTQYCSSMVITNFLPRDTNLLNSTMHVQSVASAYGPRYSRMDQVKFMEHSL